jgi:hypothetical protein
MDPRRQSHQPSTPATAAVGSTINSKLPVRILIILLIVLSACGVIYFGLKATNAVMADSAVKSKQFQAVFLTNGQVYFGTLTHVNGSYIKLTDIFYLQVNNSGSQTSVQPSTSASSQQVSLAKLGSELHGPEDVMYVNRDQVLFWENLKDSGKVVQAIKTYQKTNK